MNTNSQNLHEPTFNRSLNIGSRDAKIVVPHARAHMRAVFGGVLAQPQSSKLSQPSQPSTTVAVHQPSAKSVTSHPFKSVHSAAVRTAVKPIVASFPRGRYLDIVSRSTRTNVAPAHVERSVRLQMAPQRPTFQRVTQSAEIRPVAKPAFSSPVAKPTTTASNVTSREPVQSARANVIDRPLSLSEALASVDASPNYDNLFAPNAVDPGAKLAEKKSIFARTKKTKVAAKPAQSAVSWRAKRVARQAAATKTKAQKLAIRAEQRASRQHLSQDNKLNDNFANDLVAATAETRPQNFTSGLVSATETATMSQDEPSAEASQKSSAISFSGGAIAIDPTAFRNPFTSVNMPSISFAMPNINVRKVLSTLRITAIVMILAVSGYLAWDTWMSNSGQTSINAAAGSTMSIASNDPTTADPTAVSAQQYSAYVTPADEPRYVSIPSIGVSARVMKVGVTSSGNIDVPKKLADTAWYDGSAKPGQQGQVFIDGHTSFNSSAAASFNDLPKLKIGDQITVQTGNATNYTYKVAKTEAVPTAKVDMQQALNTYNGASKGLTLMADTGNYDYKMHDATERYVVYAVQE
ncbi:MAG: class F sortase [Candidatus Nanoperiomorbaceae bacterium]